MASADLFVYPSRTDTAGNVVLEAQASGLPCSSPTTAARGKTCSTVETGYVCGTGAPSPPHRIPGVES